jgi:hypothetical protein
MMMADFVGEVAAAAQGSANGAERMDARKQL